jgi:hypothetical protein
MKASVEHTDQVFAIFGIAFQEFDNTVILKQIQDFYEMHAFCCEFVECMLPHNSSFTNVFVEGVDKRRWN